MDGNRPSTGMASLDEIDVQQFSFRRTGNPASGVPFHPVRRTRDE
jgi:hypothetical protein